ncbi:MAG TPA: hypothetical protein VEL03_20315 [Streptosporangiaceae bacterium]|nr:hypothetical protein [Streptosporangiaceae bacterium]
MSGPGDIGGEVSGDEAAWRDLIARFDSAADPAPAQTPWPAREDLPDSQVATADGPGTESRGSPEPQLPASAEGIRIIRYAPDPRSYSPPEEADEPYVPTPLPPPAKLDAVAKAAWVALIAGPGYLLVGTLLQWTISGPEALTAIAAFIAGFVILVLKMGDRPPRDNDDDGAVL